MSLDDPLIIAFIAVGVILACSIVFYVTRRRGKKEENKASEKTDAQQAELTGYPFRVTKTVAKDNAVHAKDELRILDLEREILGDAIRRLYEAHAEGKITEQERDRLAETYKTRMMTIRDAISRDESIVALHELENMQEDLMKLFSERFDELSTKIEELRSKTETKPIREMTIAPKLAEAETDSLPSEEQSTSAEKTKRRKRQAPAKSSPRTEAEKRIEEIRAEVEKVLDKLGQMELES